jgi:SIR2-like domain
MDFETVLPRLVATYEIGRLTPFIGAGMSRIACSDWPGLVHALEQAVTGPTTPAIPASTDPAEMIRRGNTAVRSLKSRDRDTFVRAMSTALLDRGGDIPAQTRALARIWWPLVVTTNYDNYYAAAFRERPESRLFAVVGRNPEDCQRVLSSLSSAGRALLWALQGYLDQPCKVPDVSARPDLIDQLVVGHDEYRRVTYRELHFRRAFAEVFRQRSLFFLGSGIRETYLQELFGEVLELYGPSARPHYAFIPEGEVDPQFMLARFQIVVVEYPKGQHGTITEWLNTLASALNGATRAAVPWSWGKIQTRQDNNWNSVPELEVVRGPLPETPAPDECLAVSAGGSNSFVFTRGIRELMVAWGVGQTEQPAPSKSRYLGLYDGRDVFAVRARSETDTRGLADIYRASMALFEHVATRYRCIRMQLLASGGTDKREDGVADWSVRPFPERFSFIQIVRAWGAWRREHPDVPCRLALHLVAPSVYMEIASGRVDVLELLSCADVGFWAEILTDSGDVERRLFQVRHDLPLSAIVSEMNLSPEHWMVQVSPAPTLDQPVHRLKDAVATTLQDLGVVPGSTLHFRRGTSSSDLVT